MNETVNCPVCGEAGCSKAPSTKSDAFGHARAYERPRCGRFILSDFLNLSDFLKDGESAGLSLRQRAILSHPLRREQRAGSPPPSIVQSDLLQDDDLLPTPAEQADSLILWIGDRQLPHMERADVPAAEISAWIGAAIPTKRFSGCALTWLLSQDAVKNVVEWFGTGSPKTMEFRLSMAGWERYEALKHAQVKSRAAFMAMKFDTDMDHVVKNCFKPAVKAAGFELRLLTDGQPAGLIDDQLRVALRSARFMIADLTHGNNWRLLGGGVRRGLGPPGHLHLPQTGVGRQQVAFRYRPPEHDHMGPREFGRCHHALDRDHPGAPARRGEDDRLKKNERLLMKYAKHAMPL
jgi:hypothetical protein